MARAPTVYSLSNRSIQPELLTIECAMFMQLPSFQIVGLPAPEVAEARERVRAAILASGMEFPKQRVILNLSPASYRKSGTGLDLPMALGVLLNQSDPPPVVGSLTKIFAWGELALDGSLRGAGMIHRVLFAARQAEAEIVLLPAEDRAETLQVLSVHSMGGLRCAFAEDLLGAVEELSANEMALPTPQSEWMSSDPSLRTDAPPELVPPAAILETLGALTAGDHHVLLIGPQGTGKSQALEWLLWLAPPSTLERQLESKMAKELVAPMGRLKDHPGDRGRIARRVGTQVRAAALLGSYGQSQIRPGELALAHGGALVADEFAEWSRDSRELLREPLESGFVTLNRSRGSHRFQARFRLLAGSNLCPCGGCPPELIGARGKSTRACTCAEPRRRTYLERIKGPVLDRIHAVLPIFAPTSPELGGAIPRAQADLLAERVDHARSRARNNWGAPAALLTSAKVEALLSDHVGWREIARKESGSQSLRGVHHTVRLALSLAAWDGRDHPTQAHWMAAGYLRPERLGI